MLKLEHVHKKFKSALIADDICVELGPYTYGLLGRNGSGKTTLLRCITQVEKLNGGVIRYLNQSQNEVKDYLSRIGYLPQSFDIFNDLTAAEVLQFFANLKEYKISREEIDALLQSVHLYENRDSLIKTLSGGMKRRLGIAQSLIGDPETLLLDEPTAGLDPEERLNFKNVVRSVKNGKCVVLSTHIITDIESLCDKILILSNGKITEFGSCAELAQLAQGKVFAIDDAAQADGPVYSMGTVTIDGKTYEKVLAKAPVDGLELSPTVEDGYICFIENFS